MNIKLVNYPYRGYEVGEICDFGPEKNASLISLQRAVWVEEDKKESKKIAKKVVEETPQTQNKKFLANKLQQEVQKRKKGLETEPAASVAADTASEESKEEPKKFLQNDIKEKVEQRKKSTSKKSFWDKLK